MYSISIFLLLVLSVAGCIQATKRPVMLLFFLVITATVRPSGNIGSFDFSSLWLLYLIFLCLFVLITKKANKRSQVILEKLVIFFLFYCIVSPLFFFFDSTTPSYAARVLLKLLYPFLVMFIGYRFLESTKDFATIIKVSLITTFIFSLFIGGVPYLFFPKLCFFFSRMTWGYASFSDHTAIITSLALVSWKAYGKKRYLWLAIYLCISTVLMQNRTGIMATGIGISVFVLLYYRKSLSVPSLLGVYFLIMSALLLMPGMSSHMFYNPDDANIQQIISSPTSIDISNINSSGRFDMWKYLMDTFFWPRPLFGSGLGASQLFLTSYPYLFGVNHPHSDYVRLLSDTGLIGLTLYLLIIATIMMYAIKTRRGKPQNHPASICSGFVLCSFPSLLVVMGFDSATNCATAVTQFPFIFSGFMLAMTNVFEQKMQIHGTEGTNRVRRYPKRKIYVKPLP